MRIYQYRVNLDRFKMLACAEEDLMYLLSLRMDGTSLNERWTPFKVWWDPAIGGPAPDFPHFPYPVVSGRVRELMGEELSQSGELLRLYSDDGEFYFYNVTSVLDCLDEQRSSGERFPDGRYMFLRRHVFKPAAIQGHSVFTIPQMANGKDVFVTEDFRKLVSRHKLRGFRPREVWSETDGPRLIRDEI